MPSWYFPQNFESFCSANMATESCVIGWVSMGRVSIVAITFAGTLERLCNLRGHTF